MTETQKAALLRLRRKVEIMHLDLKSANNQRYHDAAEMLRLIELVEKET